MKKPPPIGGGFFIAVLLHTVLLHTVLLDTERFIAECVSGA